MRKGTYQPPTELPTLREVAEAWLASKADLRPSSRYLLENHVHHHILPRLGELRIDRINTQVIEERLRNYLLHAGRLARPTINKVLGTLTGIVDYAERTGRAERNPARQAARLRLDTAEVADDEPASAEREVDPDEVPSADEVKRLLLAAEPGLHHTYLLAAALTGARVGELLALTWDNVDFDAGQIRIRRGATWARTRAEREAGIKGARYFHPKTKGSRRDVEAPPVLLSALKRWKLACPSSSTGLVFPKADGTAMHRKTIADQALHPAQKRAGLRHFGLHMLRHFFASELINDGKPPTEVAARLGHAKPSTTMAIYVRWYAGAKSDGVTNLAARICEA